MSTSAMRSRLSTLMSVAAVPRVSGFTQTNTDRERDARRSSQSAVSIYVAERRRRADRRDVRPTICDSRHLSVRSSTTMLARSPTFRRQCARLAARAVPVRSSSAPNRRSARRRAALTAIRRDAADGSRRSCSSRRRAATAELIAHEFEHIIEQLDGVDLPVKSRLRASGVKRVARLDALRNDARDRHRTARRAGVADRDAVRSRAVDDRACRSRSWPQRRCRVPHRWPPRGPRHRGTARCHIARRARRAPPTSAPTDASVAFESLARLVAGRHRRPPGHLRPRSHDRRRDARKRDRRRRRALAPEDQRRRTLPGLRIASPAAMNTPRADIVLRDRVAGTTRVLTLDRTQPATRMAGAEIPISATTAASLRSLPPQRR